MTDLDVLPFRALLDHVVVPARRHLREVLLPVALPIVTCMLTLTVVQLRWFATFTFTEPGDPGPFFLGALAVMVVSVLAIVVYTLTFSALTVGAMNAIVEEGPVRMGRAWAFIFRPQVLLTLILVNVLGSLSFMMCFLPALYVVPLLSFVLPVMAAEGRTGIDAIRRAWEVFSFHGGSSWGWTLALLFVGGVFSYALTLAVQLPFIVAQQLILTREALLTSSPAEQMAAVMWLQIPAVVVGSLATAAAWLYPTFGLCLLFRELRRRKEAPDLEAAVEGLTG